MAIVQTSAPAIEPIALADAKAYLRIDTSDEDQVIQSMITTARLQVETALGLALIRQSWLCYFDRWPLPYDSAAAPIQPPSLAYTIPDPGARMYASAEALLLPLGPVISVDQIRVYADDGTAAVLALGDFTVDTVSRPARVTRRAATATPDPGRRLNGIEIAITAGFGANSTDVPANIRQALLLLAAHWYEHRDPADIGTPEARIPDAVSSLLSSYLPVRL